MKTEKQLRKDLKKYLKGLKKNCKKYAVFGSYKDDDDKHHAVFKEFDTKQECCDYWNEVETDIREPRYERLWGDPAMVEECEEDYNDWNDMDEDERNDVLDAHIIENYCSYEDMDRDINLVWCNQIELIDGLLEHIKWNHDILYTETTHKIHGKLITVETRGGGERTGLMLEKPTWNIFEHIAYDTKENSLTLEDPRYRVKCLINGKIHWISLYSFDLGSQCLDEAGELDYRTEWRNYPTN